MMADDIDRYATAISNIESGGRYNLVGPTHRTMGRALGRYQVMEANLPMWLREAGQPAMTSEQFLASPEAQDAVFRHRFGGYVQQFGNPEDAAQAWFAGPGSVGAAGAGGRRDSLGTSVADYRRRFIEGLGGVPAAQPTTAAAAPATSGAPDVASIVGGMFGQEQGQQPAQSGSAELARTATAGLGDAPPMQLMPLQPMAMAPRRPVDMAQLRAALASRRLGG